MSMEKRIAKITDTFLGVEDHGILTAYLSLDYGSAGQSTPGHALDEPVASSRHRVGTAYGMEFVARLMRACGVREWDKLKGLTIHALIEDGMVAGVMPLPTERGERFIFADLRDELEAVLEAAEETVG